MNRQERIAALQKALAALNRAIAATQSALQTATVPDDILQLTSQLADLQAERQNVQFQLANLQAADGEIGEISPASAAQVRALGAGLDQAILTAATVSATVDFANTVLDKVSTIRNAFA